MSRSRHVELLEKSIAACVSGIEVYNKPDFSYREETFAMLMTNAWELLLKAYILKQNGNRFRSIVEFERRTNKDGTRSKKWYVKLNRSGNPMTFSLEKAIRVVNSQGTVIDPRCIENIILLVEVRDNSIHFFNKSIGFSAKVRDIGTATLRNYMTLIHEWFDYDLSKYNFYLMPLSFYHISDVVQSFSVQRPNSQMRNLLAYLASLESEHPSDESNPYNVTLQLETRFIRTRVDEAPPGVLPVMYTTDSNAPSITITEEEALRRFPLSYKELVVKLKRRYTDFVVNHEFYRVKGELEVDSRYCHVRRLNPKDPNSSTRMKFYSTEIIKEFDRHYTRNK